MWVDREQRGHYTISDAVQWTIMKKYKAVLRRTEKEHKASARLIPDEGGSAQNMETSEAATTIRGAPRGNNETPSAESNKCCRG